MSTKADETLDISKKRKHPSNDSTDLKKAKHKRKHKKHKKSTTSSESDSSVDKKKKRSKKKRKKEKTKKKHKEKKEHGCLDVPMSLMNPSRSMAPITKDEWEKKQSIVRRVFDDSSGRYRLIKGDGEVIEEIVSKDRHKEINQQATRGDGLYFQTQLSTSQKK